MQRFQHGEEVDAVVIGTGAGGSPILARLAQAGLSVVALEAGDFQNPADFASDEVAQSYLYWLDERITDGADPVAFGKNNSGTGVGGSTLHWGAYAPRADARDFALHSASGRGVDWPIRYSDLLPYYIEAETFLGISGPADYPWDPSRRYPLPPVALNAPAQLMQRGCAELGIRTAPAPIAAVSSDYQRPEYDLRRACTNRGFCHQGCRNGAKASMDVTYLVAAVRAGAEIRPRCFALDFERDAQGRITAVVYQQDAVNVADGAPGESREVRQKCKHVFLCGGAIETPRFLLRNRLANSSGQVGRNFMAHTSTQIWGTFADETRPYKGFPASLITEDTLRPKDAAFAGGYLIQSYGIMPVTWADSVVRGRKLWGRELTRYLRNFNHVAGMGVNGDCLPSDSNYLELSNELDSRGLPKPLIHFTAGENEKQMAAHAEKTMRSIWSAVDAADVWSFNRTAHCIGTARMGNDPDQSVVDQWGKAHDLPNLWINDHSVFPSAQAANPALTIVALSLRLSDHFLGRN